MKSLLSNLVKNLDEGILKIEYKCKHDDKKCETFGIKYKDSNCFLNYTNLKEYSIYVVMRIVETNLMKT